MAQQLRLTQWKLTLYNQPAIPMKTSSKLLAALLLSVSAHSTQATVVQVIDINDPLDFHVTASTPYSYLHNISASYNKTLQTITSAVLRIVLTDPQNGNESYQIVIGGAPTSDVYNAGNINNGSGQKSVDYTLQTTTSLADLQNDGKLSFTITTTAPGEFYFANSTLTVLLDDVAGPPNAPVPEPVTPSLFAAALLGLALARRR